MTARLLTRFLVCLMVPLSMLGGIGSRDTVYVGGTLPSIKAGTEGRSSTGDDKAWLFTYEGGQLAIPYQRISRLEYGQRAGYRVALAIVALNPAAAFVKKKRHFLTINFTDDARTEGAAVFELGKDIIQSSLQALQARSARPVVYTDKGARKDSSNAILADQILGKRIWIESFGDDDLSTSVRALLIDALKELDSRYFAPSITQLILVGGPWREGPHFVIADNREGSDLVLSGNVTAEGKRVRISARLVSPTAGVVWSATETGVSGKHTTARADASDKTARVLFSDISPARRGSRGK